MRQISSDPNHATDFTISAFTDSSLSPYCSGNKFQHRINQVKHRLTKSSNHPLKGPRFCRFKQNGHGSSYGAWWLMGKFGALRAEGRKFESHSSRHVGTLDKSFTHRFL